MLSFMLHSFGNPEATGISNIIFSYKINQDEKIIIYKPQFGLTKGYDKGVLDKN